MIILITNLYHISILKLNIYSKKLYDIIEYGLGKGKITLIN